MSSSWASPQYWRMVSTLHWRIPDAWWGMLCKVCLPWVKGLDVQDYFHSTFPDVLIEDLIGFQGSHGDSFEVHPLLPKTKWKFFYLGDIRYHGHDIDILWKEDWSSKTPGMQSKLFVWVDGKRVAESNDLNSPRKYPCINWSSISTSSSSRLMSILKFSNTSFLQSSFCHVLRLSPIN